MPPGNPGLGGSALGAYGRPEGAPPNPGCGGKPEGTEPEGTDGAAEPEGTEPEGTEPEGTDGAADPEGTETICGDGTVDDGTGAGGVPPGAFGRPA